jgi:hypothetical protein
MRNLNVAATVIFFLLFSTICRAQDGKFTFKIATSANTSAGIFRDDSILVRTLWNNVYYSAGTYTSTWDGKDDNGVTVTSAATNFDVKIVTSNVKYQWQGVIGNSSRVQTGSGVHRGYYHCMRGLVFTNGYGYYCRGYAEGAPSIAKFNIADPQYKIDFAKTNQPGDISYVATDDITIYWAVQDASAKNNTLVFGSKVSNDSDVLFPAGSSYSMTFGKTYSNAISVLNQPNSNITGLAVQKQGKYLFVSRAGIDELQILNKTTGELVMRYNFNTPNSLCVDKADNLWMVTDINKLSKYTVNSDGSLSSPTLTISGVLKPAAIQVSPDGTTLAVADDSTSQQVKFFNNSTGGLTATLGTPGGYFDDPDVNNNKFYFNDLRSKKVNFIAYQPDGSFWVGDPGNYRAQHYSASRTYINGIQSLGATYQTWVDKNDISRVFVDNLEFSIDYSAQTLSATAGWKLVKNWGANIPNQVMPYGNSARYQTTLSNGKTYGLILSGFNNEVVEFPAKGPMRFTGTRLVESTKILCDDGAIQNALISGTTCQYMRFPLVGFDALDNPQWSTVPEILATSATSLTGNPTATLKNQVITSSNKIVFYNPKAWSNNVGPVFSKGFHLGIMSRGGNNWLIQTEKSTHQNYAGEFPNSGYFDEGNGVNDFAGGNVNVFGRNIITSYHGEFWKNGQTNKYNHYWDNGLAIGQFGITRAQTTGESAAMMAGNALTPVVVKDANGDYYLYHGDESDHAGVHRWKITGLNTIAEQSVPLASPTTYTPPVGYVDLMKGLPFDAVMPTNTAGWTRNPATNATVDRYLDNWTAFTGRLKYGLLTSPDILVNFVKKTAGTYSINRDLGSPSISYSWKITGEIAYPTNCPNGGSINQYFEILDSNGKILTRFYPSMNRLLTPVLAYVNFNRSIVATGTESAIKKSMNNLVPFEIKVVNGIVTFTYGNYLPVVTTIFDLTGNWKAPKTMRAIFYSGNAVSSTPVYPASVGLKDCKFYEDFVLSPLVNVAPVVNAGSDQVIITPDNNVTFNGTATDSDGFISSYSWTKIMGPAATTISSPSSASTSITGLTALGVYRYRLKVTDNAGAVSVDTVQVTVTKLNQAPVVKVGANITITYSDDSTNLSSTVTDDGSIASHGWKQISGASSYIKYPGSYTTPLTGLIPGVYKYEKTATDNLNVVSKDTITVTVNLSPTNKSPIVKAGLDKTMTLPTNSTSLYGSASDPDGTIKRYTWTKVSGPALGVIASPAAPTTIIYNLAMGVYLFELAVTDNMYAVKRDTVKITVFRGAVNQVPVVNAGPNKKILAPANMAAVTGSGYDLEGPIASYQWRKVSGPASYHIHSVDSPTTALSLLVSGTYVFELRVTDNQGATAKDSTTVSVSFMSSTPPVVNQPPKSNAGADKVIISPSNSVTVNGSGTDSDGSIVKYYWTKVGGLGTFNIVSPNSASTTISNLQQGSHQFQLKVTDDDGAYAYDYVQVTVKPAGRPTSNNNGNNGNGIGNGNGNSDGSGNSGNTDNTSKPPVVAPPKFEYKTNEVLVYPNPVNDFANLNITTVKPVMGMSMTVYNSLGVKMFQKETTSTKSNSTYRLDFSSLSDGAYIIIVRFADGSSITKTAIKKRGG